jgi:hypothetical protein
MRAGVKAAEERICLRRQKHCEKGIFAPGTRKKKLKSESGEKGDKAEKTRIS